MATQATPQITAIIVSYGGKYWHVDPTDPDTARRYVEDYLRYGGWIAGVVWADKQVSCNPPQSDRDG